MEVAQLHRAGGQISVAASPPASVMNNEKPKRRPPRPLWHRPHRREKLADLAFEKLQGGEFKSKARYAK